MRGEDQSVYVFRVIDADPSRPPNSLDEVRDQVTADLARLRHFKQLVEQSDALRREALDKGLLNMALGRNTSVRRAGNITLTDLGTLFAAGNLGSASRQPTALPVIGVNEATVEAIVDRAMMLDPTIPMDELADAERTFVLPVEDNLAVMIVRIASQSPLTSETFSTYAGLGIVQRPILAEEMGDGDEVKQVFGYDALAARYGFKLASGPAEDPIADEDQVATPDA